MKIFIYKNIRKEFHKYVNGTKGVISIFLALCMLPFTTIALLLTESARYQSVVQMVNELIDTVGYSTVAGYDSYLDNRFGLFAVDQSENVNSLFAQNLADNMNALPNGFTHTSSNVEGKLPLSNLNVLRNQLMDYGELTMPIEMLDRGFDLSSLIGEFEKMLTPGKFQDFCDATSASLDTAKSCTELVNAVEDSIIAYNEFSGAISAYHTAADNFYDKCGDLVSETNSAISDLDSDEDTDSIYDETKVKKAVGDLESARDDFAGKANDLAGKIRTLATKIEKIYSSLAAIDNNAIGYDQKIDKLAGNKDVVRTTDQWMERIRNGLESTLADVVVQNTYQDEMGRVANDLDTETLKLYTVVCDRTALNATNDADHYYINNESWPIVIEGDFPKYDIVMHAISEDFSSALRGEVDDLNNHESKLDTSSSNSIMEVLDIAGSLISLTGIYNGTLDAVVDPNCFYLYKGDDDLDPDTWLVIHSLSSIVNSGKHFVESLTTLNILKALQAACEFLEAVVTFLLGIVAWLGVATLNLLDFITHPDQMYDTIVLSGYCAFNLPNRTNFSSGSTLTYSGLAGGASYISVYTLMGGTSKTDYFSGMLDDVDKLTYGTGTGDKCGFLGAESEYILVGSDNELMNQSATFFNIYLLRLVLNIWNIMNDPEVKVAAANPAGWAVYLAYIITEPFLDTLLIVNGGSVDLFKDDVFLTGTGIGKFTKEMLKLTGLNKSTQELLNAYASGKGIAPEPTGEPEKKKVDLTKKTDPDEEKKKKDEKKFEYKPKTDYTETICFLIWLKCNQNQMLERLRNLITMECKKKYLPKKIDFNLDNAYTCIDITTQGKLNAMFDLKELTNGHLFTIKKNRVIGY